MGDILKGIYTVPRDERGRRIKGAPLVRVQPDIEEPVSIVVPVIADLDAEDEPATLVGSVPPAGPFDPHAHSVAEVLAYLADNPDERETVIALESQGRARKTIIHSAP